MRNKNCKNIKSIELPVAKKEVVGSNVMNEIINILSTDNKIKVVGLGLFTVKVRRARKHFSGIGGKYVKLPERKVISFKADKELLKKI